MEAAKPQVPCQHCKRGAAAATKVGATEEPKTNEAEAAKLVKGLHEIAVHLAQVAPAVIRSHFSSSITMRLKSNIWKQTVRLHFLQKS